MATLIDRGFVNTLGLDSISQYHAIRHALLTGQELSRTLGIDGRITDRGANYVVVTLGSERHRFEVECRPMRSREGHVLYPFREQDILIHEIHVADDVQCCEIVLATGQPYPKHVS